MKYIILATILFACQQKQAHDKPEPRVGNTVFNDSKFKSIGSMCGHPGSICMTLAKGRYKFTIIIRDTIGGSGNPIDSFSSILEYLSSDVYNHYCTDVHFSNEKILYRIPHSTNQFEFKYDLARSSANAVYLNFIELKTNDIFDPYKRQTIHLTFKDSFLKVENTL